MMDSSEVEENLLLVNEPKLHGGMSKNLCAVYLRVLAIFPDLEAARPRSTSGIQALCALHIALEKTKNVLRHCAECSKLYLAITGDSVVLKFEKARCALEDSLRQVEDVVPQAICCQIAEILDELRGIEFSLDPAEKQIGDDIIASLQQGRNFNRNGSGQIELESFHQAASKLGITSSRAAVRERRALKKLIDRARSEGDQRKELIVANLLHLMKKYSKLFRNEFSDDNDSQGSSPCSPTVQGSLEDDTELRPNDCTFGRQLTKLGSFNFKQDFRRPEQMPVPPEELRCPISLQLMYDPVIIASGQTYERVCIEKWFSDGHNTCPKTQQQLPHLCLTPNYCVKGLVANWCEQNGILVPDHPPESLDLNYWRQVLSDGNSANSKTLDNVESGKFKGVKVVPLNDSVIIEEAQEDVLETGPAEKAGENEVETGPAEEAEENEVETGLAGKYEANEVKTIPAEEDELDVNALDRYEEFLNVLEKESDLRKKCKVVEQLRLLLKDDEEARIYMGANGFVEALLHFLKSAVHERNEMAQEIGAMALFNLAVNNNRNKEMMLASGFLSVLEEMIANTHSVGAATALYLNMSCLQEAKPIIGSSEAVPFLIRVLKHKPDSQCKLDSLHALYNLSCHPQNIPHLLSSGIIDSFQALLSQSGEHSWTEKCIAVLINLASSKSARDEIILAPGIISGLASILDVGEPIEQEQAAACLLILCSGNEKCSQIVLQEGVIPSLVSISVNGTTRGKQKSQKLLMLFREQRAQDPPPCPVTHPRPESSDTSDTVLPVENPKLLSKSISTRKLGNTWSFWRKNKSFSVHQR